MGNRTRTLVASIAVAVLAAFSSAYAVATQAPVIHWSGPGTPSDLPFGVDTTLPVIIANTTSGSVPRRDATLALLVQPRPDDSTISWSASPAANARVTDRDAPTFSASPFQMLALAGSRFGPARIFANLAKPKKQRVSIAAYSYRAAAIGCYSGIPGGITFNRAGVAVPATSPAQSDVYETGPANTKEHPLTPLTGCTGAFVAPSGEDFTIHIPGGATVLSNTTKTYFPFVGTSAWTGNVKELAQFTFGDILIFKTRDGRIGKLLSYPFTGPVLEGAYLLSAGPANFSDATYFKK